MHPNYPDPPILAFFDFLAFFVLRGFPCFFCAFFPSFPRISGVRRRGKSLYFSGDPRFFFAKIDSVNIWCIVFFPVLKPLAYTRQSRCRGWTYKLPGCQKKFSITLSTLSLCWISAEKTFKFDRKTPVYKLPRGAIYKPPGVQLINNPFFAIHQVFSGVAPSNQTKERSVHELFAGAFRNKSSM